MRRRLLNLLTTLSLLLFLALSVLWVRSFFRSDLVEFVVRDGWSLSVMLGHGAADLISSAELPGVTTSWTTDPAPVGATTTWGFHFDFEDYPAWLVRVPLWFPATLAGILPAARGWRRVRRVRRARLIGHCARCGHDLTGNVSGACPECGTTTRGSPRD